MEIEVTSLARKLRSAVRTGRRLHLEPGEIAVLLHDDIYSVISRLEADAMRKQCQFATANDNSLGIIGSGGDLAPEPGPSAGSKTDLEALSRGARARALSEAKLAIRRKKP